MFKNSGVKVAIVECDQIPTGTFANCASLEYVYVYNPKALEGSPFDGCTHLKTIFLPNLISLGKDDLKGITSITILDLPITTIDIDSLNTFCTTLERLNLPNLTSIPAGMFNRAGETVPIVFSGLKHCMFNSLTALPTGNFTTAKTSLKTL